MYLHRDTHFGLYDDDNYFIHTLHNTRAFISLNAIGYIYLPILVLYGCLLSHTIYTTHIPLSILYELNKIFFENQN